MTQTAAALVGWIEGRQAEVQVELAEVLEKSNEILMWDVNAVWREIEAAADKLVEKSSGPLTCEQAVARVLRTPKGAAMYDDYLRKQDLVRQSLELAEGSAARRGHDQWVREQTVDTVAKTADRFGDDAAEQRARELVRDPAVAKAFGGRARQPLEKTSRSWDEIERRAAALVQKSEGLSQAQAVERVLQERPDLYASYMAPVEREWASEAAALAKADGGPALNTGEGVSGPSLSGSADGEPLSGRKTRSARRALVELAERLERAEADGEDVDGVLAEALRDPGVRRVVVAAIDGLPEDTEKAAASKRELRRRLEGLEESGRKPRRRPREDPTTGAAVAKSEDELWHEIVRKSGVSLHDPQFSRVVDGFLGTPEGQQLYAQYERAYEARAAALT